MTKIFCRIWLLFPLVAFGQVEDRSAEAARLLAAGKWAEAIRAYDEIIADAPDDGAAKLRRAIAIQESGDVSGALAAFAELTTTRPIPQVFYRLARAQAKSGQSEAAFTNLRRAIVLGFANHAALERDADLATLRNDSRFAPEVEKARVAARPGQLLPEYRALDFLLGEWEQKSKDGRKVGTSKITAINDGCALLQIDENPPGYTAHSVYSIYPESGQWSQIYFDSRAAFYRYNVMPREGEVVTQLQPTPHAPMLYRNTLTRLDPDRLRFLIEGSLDAGASWFVFFDGFFVRIR